MAERTIQQERARRTRLDPDWTRGLALVVYAVVMTAVLTAVLIPARSMTAAAVHRLSREGIEVTVGKDRRLYPFGLSWEGVAFRVGREWRADRVSARIDFLSLLRLRPAIRWSVGIASGSAEGLLWRSGGGAAIEGRGEGIPLERLMLAADASQSVRGTAGFTVKGTWGAADPKKNTGLIDLTANGLSVPGFSTPAGPVPDLHFDNASATIEMTGGVGTLRTLRASGREIDVTGEGSCLVREPLDNSLLNLTIRVAPRPGAPREGILALLDASGKPGLPAGQAGGESISVKGTLGSPTIAAAGVPLAGLPDGRAEAP